MSVAAELHTPQAETREDELKSRVDQRVAQLLGVSAEQLTQLENSSPVMMTPVVVSIVRATAYVRC